MTTIPHLSTVGRVLLALIFILSGIGKIGAPEATLGYIASVGIPFPMLAYLAAIVTELGGGALLLVGYKSRLVSLLLAAFTVATALIFHNNLGDQNQMIHFLKNLAIAGGLLQVAAMSACPSADGSTSVTGGRSPTESLKTIHPPVPAAGRQEP